MGRMGLIVRCFILIFIFVECGNTATYYIDYETGDDSNNGTSTSTPWKLAPGMQGCLITDANDNNCRARTHATTSGDLIILKGGVTWPKECFSWDWYFGNATYFGVDLTWYTGAAWTRPILDLEGTEATLSPESSNRMLRAYGTDQIVDNIEFTGMAQLHGLTNGYAPAMLQIGTNSGS